MKVRLEYYFEGVGQISVGAIRRSFENFFGNVVFPATPDFLALYSLDPAIYGAYDVSTQHNITSTVRMEGFNIDYKQVLTFLPSWARGVQVFANANSQRALGDDTGNFAGYVPRSGSWGASLTRPKFNVRMNWNYRGRQRANRVAAGASVAPDTFTWEVERLYLDVSAEYNLRRRFALFASLRNVTGEYADTEVYGSSTPAHARLRQRTDIGALWTVGIKGSF